MTKTLFSTVTLLLLLQGCGSSSSNNSGSKNNGSCSTTEVSADIKSFASSFKKFNSIGKSTGKSSSSALDNEKKNKQVQQKQIQEKQTLESCDDGGTRKISTDVDFENISQADAVKILRDGYTVAVDSTDCIEDGEKTNASMSIVAKLNGELLTLNINFNKTSTFEDLETAEITTITKNSNMEIKEISDNEEITTENINASSSKGERYKTVNLVTHDTDLDSTESIYEVSGKRVENGKTYSVDTNYDASKTPMVIEDNSGDLIRGTAKYVNEKNEHITIEVVGKNRIKVSVDNNNDGVDDAEETIDL